MRMKTKDIMATVSKPMAISFMNELNRRFGAHNGYRDFEAGVLYALASIGIVSPVRPTNGTLNAVSYLMEKKSGR